MAQVVDCMAYMSTSNRVLLTAICKVLLSSTFKQNNDDGLGYVG